MYYRDNKNMCVQDLHCFSGVEMSRYRNPYLAWARVNLTKWYLTKQLPIKFEHKIEPHHNTTSKRICAPSEDSGQAGHPPSLISLPIERTD